MSGRTEYEKFLLEVSARLTGYPNLKPGNHYNSPTPTLGLSVPQSRAALKNGYSFLKLPADKVLLAFDHIWFNARYFEEMSQSIYFYEKKSLPEHHFTTISRWIDRCDNWAHSDGLSSIYARALEESPEIVLPVLRSWNRSENPWKRRQSVVSLLYYSRLRRRTQPFEVMIELVAALLQDDDYYVQKGAGWAIRELYNRFQEKTLNFISENINSIAPAAWQASSEKLPAETRKQLLIRRKSRM